MTPYTTAGPTRPRPCAGVPDVNLRVRSADRFVMCSALLVLMFLWPAPASATVGFAERHSELLYSDVAFVHWIHPGDGCDCGTYCFQLLKSEPRGGGFEGLYRSLAKINAPAETELPLVIAQDCSDRHWLVYDLTAEEYLADTESYALALAIWRSRGLADPSFADAAEGARGLHQTWRSHAEDVAMLLMMFLPMLAVLSFPLCLFASLRLFARYRRTRNNKDRVWAWLVLVPTIPGWWLAWLVFSSATGSHVSSSERQAMREYQAALENRSHGTTTDEEQLARLDLAVQLDPTAVEYRELRAAYLSAVGRLSEAKADLDRAIELADRPNLRFARAGVLCALGSYEGALVDLDQAIVAQPENAQFYPSRAVARAAVGRIEETRTDAEAAIARAPEDVDGLFARSIVLRAQGQPEAALADLDPIAANRANPNGAPCLTPVAALQREGRALKTAAVQAMPPTLRTQAFGIEESTDTRAYVALEREGLDPRGESLGTLKLLDGRGVRLAHRIGVRDVCSKASDDPLGPDYCHPVGEYAYSGLALERFALAFEASVKISPKPLDRTPLPRTAQIEHLAKTFEKGFSLVDGTYAAGWQRVGSGDWVEQLHCSDLSSGETQPEKEPTGTRFTECSLAAVDAITEIECPRQRTVYLDDQYLGTSDELALGSAVRYAADVNGVRVYVVIRSLNSMTSPVLVFRSGSEWKLLEVRVSRGGC